MTFNEYQDASRATAIYPPMGHPVVYPVLGLGDESGEVQGKIKKIFRDKGGYISPDDRYELAQELGDVLWYLAQICTELDLPLSGVARDNLAKLQDRQERGVIGGDGDNR